MAWKIKKSGEKKEDSYLYQLSGDEDDRLRKEYDSKCGLKRVTRIPLKKSPVRAISYGWGRFHNFGISRASDNHVSKIRKSHEMPKSWNHRILVMV